jgi:hypothetical protein
MLEASPTGSPSRFPNSDGVVGRDNTRIPEKATVARARQTSARERRRPHRPANSFAKRSIMCEGKHGARSSKLAIAIGLSKARRVALSCPRLRQVPGPRPSAASARRAAGRRGKTSMRRARAPAARSSEKDAVPHRGRPYRVRPLRRRDVGRRQHGVPRHAAQLGRRDWRSGELLHEKPPERETPRDRVGHGHDQEIEIRRI